MLLLMPDAAYLRDQAVRCRRLAGLLSTPDVVKTLLEMAREYEEKAAELEAKPPADSGQGVE